MVSRPLLFYSQWPLDYFNPEAKRKAEALADEGYDVVYVAGVGLRNPRISSARKAVDRVRRRLRGEAGAARSDGAALATRVVAVAPPRQYAAVRRLNVAWVRRQLRAAIPDWERAVAWVRWPTPELVAAMAADPPAAVVYECVDAYEVSPGVTGIWAPIYESAERQLVEMADLVVAPAESLAGRFRSRARAVRVIPHGVEPELFSGTHRRAADGTVQIGFAGTLDYRLDIDVLRALAEADSTWRLRLIGPVQEGFHPSRLRDLANVSIEAPIPHERVAAAVAGFDVGILPYVRRAPHYLYEYTDPIKASELLAAGRPAVARRNTALERLSGGIYFAETPTEFVAQTRRALADDSDDLSRARRDLVADGTWEHRLQEIRECATGLTAPELPQSP